MFVFKSKIGWWILLIVWLLSSCQETTIDKIDQYIDELDEAIADWPELQKKDFSTQSKKGDELVEFLGPYFSTMSKSNVKILVDLSNTVKAQKKFGVSTDTLANELQTARTQMIGLYNDYKKEKINETQLSEYYAEEMTYYNSAMHRFVIFRNHVNYLEMRYSELLPQAEDLVDSLKSVH